MRVLRYSLIMIYTVLLLNGFEAINGLRVDQRDKKPVKHGLQWFIERYLFGWSSVEKESKDDVNVEGINRGRMYNSYVTESSFHRSRDSTLNEDKVSVLNRLLHGRKDEESETENPSFAPSFSPTFSPTLSPVVSACSTINELEASNTKKRRECNKIKECTYSQGKCSIITQSPTLSPTVFSCDMLNENGGRNQIKKFCNQHKDSCDYDEETKLCFQTTPFPSQSPTVPTYLPTSEPTSSPTEFDCEAINEEQNANKRRRSCTKAKEQCVFENGDCVRKTLEPSVSPTFFPTAPPTIAVPTISPIMFSCEDINQIGMVSRRREECKKHEDLCHYSNKKRECSEKTFAPSTSPTLPQPTVSPTELDCEGINLLKNAKARREECQSHEGFCVYNSKKKACATVTNTPTASPSLPVPTVAPTVFSCEGFNSISNTKTRREECNKHNECEYVRKSKQCVTLTPSPTTSPTFPAPTASPTEFSCDGVNSISKRGLRRKECQLHNECEFVGNQCRLIANSPTISPTLPTPSASPTVFACSVVNTIKNRGQRRKECNNHGQCEYVKNECKLITPNPTTSPTIPAPTMSPTVFSCSVLNKRNCNQEDNCLYIKKKCLDFDCSLITQRNKCNKDDRCVYDNDAKACTSLTLRFSEYRRFLDYINWT